LSKYGNFKFPQNVARPLFFSKKALVSGTLALFLVTRMQNFAENNEHGKHNNLEISDNGYHSANANTGFSSRISETGK
jgi:hypothetical protein